MTTNASRQPVDLDAFEPEARPAPRPAAPRPDPLAELARIVGQDDPFRALLEAQGSRLAPRAPHERRIEPAFEPAAVRQAAGETRGAEPASLRGSLDPDETPADAFDRYLAEVERETEEGHGDPGYHDGLAPDEAPVAAERPRGRRRLLSVGLGLGVCVAAVAGAMTYKGLRGHRGADGQPVMVMADRAPLKVAPQDAGGVEIPDQNKQIYDRTAKDGQVRIVNREEQPLDVSQVASQAASQATNQAARAASVSR